MVVGGWSLIGNGRYVVWRRRVRETLSESSHYPLTTIHQLGFYGRLIDEHHRDIVLDGIHAVTLLAFEGGAVLDECDRRLAVGTGQDFEQLGVDRHEEL